MLKKILLAFIALTFTITSQAQERWSLEKCIQYAQQNNLDLKQAGIVVRNAQLTEKGNSQARYPNLNAGASGGVQFGRTVDPVTNAFNTSSLGYNSLTLTAGITIFEGGRIKNNLEQSKVDIAAAQANADQSANDIALNVATAYLLVLFNEDQLENANFRISLTQTQLDQTNRLIRAGTRPESDRLDIEAQLATDEQNQVGRQNDLEISLLNLKQLLQLQPDYNLRIERPTIKFPEESDVETFMLKSIYEKALTNQPSIKAGELNRRSAELGIKIAKANKMPRLTAFAQLNSNFSSLAPDTDTDIRGYKVDPVFGPSPISAVSINGMPSTIQSTEQVVVNQPEFFTQRYFNQLTANFGQQIGLSLNIPIYNNSQTDIAMERAELNMKSTELNNNIVKQRLKQDIQRAIADAKAAKKALDASQKSVDALKLAYENTEKRFKLGAVNTFQFTTSKNNWDQAKVNLIVSKYDYLFKLKVVDFYQGNKITLDK